VNNGVLRKIVGFECLRQVKDGIFIADNSCLTAICGFVHLYRTDRVVISNNANLNKIIGFCWTDTINIELAILDNNSAGNQDLVITAFLTLEVAENVIIIGNQYLKYIALDTLRSVPDKFRVRSNPQLISLSSSVITAGSIAIENNNDLVHLHFPELIAVNDILNINNNATLQVLKTFPLLARVGGGIMIAQNAQLCEIKDFASLKYIGSSCNSPVSPTASACCNCIAGVLPNWLAIFVPCTPTSPCTVLPCVLPPSCCAEPLNLFDPTLYDFIPGCSAIPPSCVSVIPCAYVLPADFYAEICNVNNNCCNNVAVLTGPAVIDYSLIIFGNPRLYAISAFHALKHVQASIFIIANALLHTIHAFEQLHFALDIWIRNNPNIKYIIGFNNLMSIRDLVVLETVCLCEWHDLRKLEFAQLIALESKTSKAIQFPKHPIPSVLGYNLYYSFKRNCNRRPFAEGLEASA